MGDRKKNPYNKDIQKFSPMAAKGLTNGCNIKGHGLGPIQPPYINS